MKALPYFSSSATALLALAILATGCSERNMVAVQDKAADSISTAHSPAADQWLGQWNGPEGTFLQIAGGKGTYQVTVRNLDGARTFAGKTADTGGIAFERDGTRHVIHASNGTQTGMKWLAGKSNCLTVRPGEGYCRD